MIKESYLANWRNLPEGAIPVFVTRTVYSILAPSANLLMDFKNEAARLKATGLNDMEAHNDAWINVDYERRFREEILGNPEAIKFLKVIANRAKNRDV